MTTLRNGPIDRYTPPLAVHVAQEALAAPQSTAVAVTSNASVPAIRDSFLAVRSAPGRTWLGFLGQGFAKKPDERTQLLTILAKTLDAPSDKRDWKKFDAAFDAFKSSEPSACADLAPYLLGEIDKLGFVPIATFHRVNDEVPATGSTVEPSEGPAAGALDVTAKASAVILLNEMMGSLGRDEPYRRIFDMPRFEAFMRSATSPKRTDVERAMLGLMATRIKAASACALPSAIWQALGALVAGGKPQSLEAHDEATRLLGSIDGYTGDYYTVERMGWRETNWGYSSDYPKIGQLAATLSFQLNSQTQKDALR